MEFNENTVFPVFSKCSKTLHHTYFFSNCACITFYANKVHLDSSFDTSGYGLAWFDKQIQITKEEFIEANKELLEKTGLINLFEIKSVLEVTTEQMEIESLKEEAKQLSQRLEVAKTHDIEQLEEIKFLKKIIKKLT